MPRSLLRAPLFVVREAGALEFLEYLVTGLCQEGEKPSGKGLVSHPVSIEVESWR